MQIWKKKLTTGKICGRAKRLRFEQLEDKRLLAIVWANEFDAGADNPNFNLRYGA